MLQVSGDAQWLSACLHLEDQISDPQDPYKCQVGVATIILALEGGGTGSLKYAGSHQQIHSGQPNNSRDVAKIVGASVLNHSPLLDTCSDSEIYLEKMKSLKQLMSQEMP